MIVEALRRENVDTVFGYPGGAVIPIFDALYDASSIRVILVRHEQAAVHAADGYARATGRVGVCIATSGPGATNTVTGLATARFDSVPLVCITGQVSRAMIGADAFQEADTIGITQPVTKHNYLVMKRSGLGAMLKQSFHIAASGRPGPVVIDVPKDLQLEKLDDEYPESVTIRGYKPDGSAPLDDVKALAAAIEEAKRPLFLVGGGMVIAEAAGIFGSILAATGIPVVTSLMGIGVVGSSHPRNLGMIGMHGSIEANKALTACDLLVGLGVRFDDRATGNTARFAPEAKIAHVDIDPSSIGRNLRVDIPVVGDLRLVLEELAPLLHSKAATEWVEAVEGFRGFARAFEGRHEGEVGATPTPRAVLSVVNELLPEAIVATEVGQNQMWAAQYLAFDHPRRWLTSGGLGTMGYGFPAGMGAQAAQARGDALPGKSVVVIAGDGSFQMNIQELATCVQEDLPLIVVVMNNGYLGMVRQWQELFFDRRYSSVCLQSRRSCDRTCGKECAMPDGRCPPYSPDFAAIARAYGALGFSAKTLEEFRNALSAAIDARRPAVIDCAIGREENVWPIVAPGKGNDEMLYKGVLV
ncbi:MAG: acetolactate synthase, large subunit, biosynthetic type [Spirochaetae bacterium HGW-Spirochaetae-9]|nr:MAG: acetolactate synthase, large subunit, biosynthetic type [Spirochaetae bacterium HGW-Spirochaetae-9]